MTGLPQHFIWTGHDFEPTAPAEGGEILVADSWRVREGQVWGLEDHLHRFFAGITAQAEHIGEIRAMDPAVFETALRHRLALVAGKYPGIDLFPRISLEADGRERRLILVARRAPTPRPTTSLWIPNYTDPRIRPTVKGPDIDLMRRLVSEAPADDVVLHDGTNVIETTTGTLLVWEKPTELVFCQATQQLASISAQRIAKFAKSQSLAVTHRPVTIQQIATGEYPVWFANTLHGISPVTTIGSASGEKLIVDHPKTALWQAAWWSRFTEVPRAGLA